MKNIILITISLIILMSCGNKQEKYVQPTSKIITMETLEGLWFVEEYSDLDWSISNGQIDSVTEVKTPVLPLGIWQYNFTADTVNRTLDDTTTIHSYDIISLDDQGDTGLLKTMWEHLGIAEFIRPTPEFSQDELRGYKFIDDTHIVWYRDHNRAEYLVKQ